MRRSLVLCKIIKSPPDVGWRCQVIEWLDWALKPVEPSTYGDKRRYSSCYRLAETIHIKLLVLIEQCENIYIKQNAYSNIQLRSSTSIPNSFTTIDSLFITFNQIPFSPFYHDFCVYTKVKFTQVILNSRWISYLCPSGVLHWQAISANSPDVLPQESLEVDTIY